MLKTDDESDVDKEDMIDVTPFTIKQQQGRKLKRLFCYICAIKGTIGTEIESLLFHLPNIPIVGDALGLNIVSFSVYGN